MQLSTGYQLVFGLFDSLLLIACMAVIAAERAYFWHRSSCYYERVKRETLEKLGQANEQIAGLTADLTRFQAQATSSQNTWDFVANYVANGGALLALTTIRKHPVQTIPTEEQSGPHRGSEADIFIPVPIFTVKKDEAGPVERVPVVVLTDKADDEEADSFHIVVLQPQKVLAQADLQMLIRPVFEAHIHITVIRDLWQQKPTQYQLYIEPTATISQGASSLAMDWLVKRAKKEGVGEIFGFLTHSITSEAHRGRLHNFYLKKHGFVHTPVGTETRLSKLLPILPSAEQ